MISIAFTGGGTGGHIYPGLAVASHLKSLFPCRLFWIGSNSGMEKTVVENSGIEFFSIPSGKLRRNFSLQNIGDIFKIAAGFFAARRILKREGASFLFSKGGFVSVPPSIAAASLKIPLFTHESDYSPGLATKINALFAAKIFIPYKESAAFFRNKKKIVVSGNPIRWEFETASGAKGRAFLGLGEDERILLVLGGSQGSREINALVRAALPELSRYYTVVHQTGDQTGEQTGEHQTGETQGPFEATRYRQYGYFKEEISHIIAAAELVLCRSGAGTIWECKSLKKPMVLIPLRGSGTRGDQVENAHIFEKAGAAVCFIPSEDDLENSAQRLIALIASLAGNQEKLRVMGEAGVSESDCAAGLIANEIAAFLNLK